jgi:hypothetical protein
MGETLRLESILRYVEQRQVTNDYTVSWEGKRWQIPRQHVKPGLRRSKLRIEARLDGTVVARIGEQFVVLSICEKPEKRQPDVNKGPARRHVPAPGESRWITSVCAGPRAAIAEPREKSLRQQGI